MSFIQQVLLFTSKRTKLFWIVLIVVTVALTWARFGNNSACIPTTIDSNNEYWEKEYSEDQPLHVYNHWLVSQDTWNRMVFKTSLPLGIREGDSIFDSGCGSGAYVAALQSMYPNIKVAGADFSKVCVF
jgi:SAM-dependent methyltransferase